jgi:hypothetical protein
MIKTHKEILVEVLPDTDRANIQPLKQAIRNNPESFSAQLDKFTKMIKEQQPIRYLKVEECVPFIFSYHDYDGVQLQLVGGIDFATEKFKVMALCCFEVADKEEEAND